MLEQGDFSNAEFAAILDSDNPRVEASLRRVQKMKIHIETQPQLNARLSVMTYEVIGTARVPKENIFIGLRREATRERTNQIDRWSNIADEVTADAVPGPRQ